MEERKRMTKVVTGIVTLINAHIWQPVSINSLTPIYTATIIIPKSDTKTMEGINMAIDNILHVGSCKHRRNYMRKAVNNLPLIDGDAEGMAEVFKNAYIINAASITPPIVYDYKVHPISEVGSIGSGSKVRVSLAMYSYMKNGIAGVGCKLGNIQQAGSERNKIVSPDTNFEKFILDFIRIFDAD